MNQDTLKIAIAEARRFIRIAKTIDTSDAYVFYGCKETAATRRASMDLTRALADLRRSS